MNRREFCGALISSVIVKVLNPRIGFTQQLPEYLECKTDYLHEVSSKYNFERYLYNLLSQNYYPVTLEDISNYFHSGIASWPENSKLCAITFDDRLNSQYRNAVPILDKWRVKATFACMGPEWPGDRIHDYFSNEKLIEISQYWEIASHTINHANLNGLRVSNFNSWQAEIVQSKYRLEELIGKEVTTMVYPEGAFDIPTLTLVSQYYKIAASTLAGREITRTNLFNIPRSPVNI